MKKYKLVIEAVAKYKGLLLSLVLLYLCLTGLSLWFPKVQGDLIDSLANKNPAGLKQTTFLIIVILVASVIVGFLGEVIAWLYTTRVKERILGFIGHGLVHKQMDFYRKYDTGYTTARSFEVLQLEPLFGITLISTAMTVLSGIGSLVLIFRIDVLLSTICLGLVSIYVAASYFYTGPLKAKTQIQQENLSRLNSLFVSFYQAMISFRLLNRESFFNERFGERNKSYFRAEFHTSFLRSQFNMFSKMPSQIAPVIVLIVGGARVMDGSLTVGRLFEFLGYLPLLYLPLQTLSNFYITFVSAKVCLERLNHLMEDHNEDQERGRPDFEETIKVLKADKVNFAYDAGKPLIQNLSFQLERGNVAALIGPSGSGKTTVLNMIMDSLQPTGGQISFNGTNYLNYSRKSKNRKILYLPSTPELFLGSLKDNLCLGEAFTDDEIKTCLEKVNMWEKVCSLPQGLQTTYGEMGGTHFSAGEKQRLVLARIFLRNADILIADEITSNLDAANEQAIVEILTREFADKILLFVSHNLKDFYGIDKEIRLVPPS